MTLTRYRLGDLIEKYDKKCNIPNLTVNDISGINRDKEFFEPSKQVGKNTINYKFVPVGHFATNLMHVGRDIVLPVAYNHSSKNKIVSPAYTVFKVKDNVDLIDQFLFIYFNSNERDRYFWFSTDASIRDGLSWEDFCDNKIDLPPLDIQKKYVAIYKAMLENQAAYEKGLGDLKLACDVSLDNLAQNSDFKKIGTFIKRNNLRNSDVSFTIDDVKGFNNVGEFIKPMRLFSGDISKFKIIKNNYFVYNSRINSNIKRLSIALNLNQSLLVSPAYETFYVSNEKELNSSYLYMLLQQDIFARKVLYNSFGSSTLVFGFNELCDIKIPVPNIKEQIYISNIFESYKNRYKINEKLKERLKNICPILIKGAVEEAKIKEA